MRPARRNTVRVFEFERPKTTRDRRYRFFFSKSLVAQAAAARARKRKSERSRSLRRFNCSSLGGSSPLRYARGKRDLFGRRKTRRKEIFQPPSDGTRPFVCFPNQAPSESHSSLVARIRETRADIISFHDRFFQCFESAAVFLTNSKFQFCSTDGSVSPFPIERRPILVACSSCSKLLQVAATLER